VTAATLLILTFEGVAAAAQVTIGSSFDLPYGVAVDHSGNVYVAILGHGRVEEVTPEGVQTTIGSGFAAPEGVAVDLSGNVYVADALAGRVFEVGLPPSITGFSPTSGPVGTVVTIKGSNLFAASEVTVNRVSATITKDAATEIKIKVPDGSTSGKIKVLIGLGTARTITAFTVT
jgi:sugar lactone lactonase YvrE